MIRNNLTERDNRYLNSFHNGLANQFSRIELLCWMNLKTYMQYLLVGFFTYKLNVKIPE